jgi:hypothetical protein
MTKEELINKHRDINVDGDWWYESVYEWFEEECEKRGVAITTHQETHQTYGGKPVSRMVKDITWSGFWSQGDGAAFGGKVVDLNKALGDLYLDYPILHKYVEELGGYRYCSWTEGRNNNIVFHGLEIEPIANYLEDDHPFAEVWQEQLNKEHEEVENTLNDLAGELCGLLYKALEDEYSHMTSDEAVWETIVANELDKEVA